MPFDIVPDGLALFFGALVGELVRDAVYPLLKEKVRALFARPRPAPRHGEAASPRSGGDRASPAWARSGAPQGKDSGAHEADAAVGPRPVVSGSGAAQPENTIDAGR